MAVDMKVLLSKFPGEWSWLFATLCSPEKPLKTAEIWYRQTQFTRNGRRLSWSQFCEACLEAEPAIQDNKLVFIPRILHFPFPFLRLLVAFIHFHKSEVPRRHLAEIADTCKSPLVKDEIIHQLVQLLDEHISGRKEREEKSAKETAVEHGEEQMDAEPGSPVFGRVTSSGEPDIVDVDTPVLTQQRRPLEPSSAEPSVKRLRLDLETDLLPQDMEVLISSEGSSPECLDRPGSELLEVTEKTKVTTTAATLASVRCMKEQASQLLELLVTSRESDLPEHISLLSQCTNQQISELCGHLSVDTLPETAVGLLCHHVCRLHTQFSYHISLCILKQALLPKLQTMGQKASRVMLNTFMMAAKQFPRQLIEGVLVPAMSDPKFGSLQCDLVMKLMEESLSPDQKVVLLSQYLQYNQEKTSPQWNESLIILLNHIIDAKVDIPESDMTRLLTAVEANSFSHAKNLKFGKFILRLVNKYGSQLTPSQHAFLRQAVESHQSFLSKSIQGALNKVNR